MSANQSRLPYLGANVSGDESGLSHPPTLPVPPASDYSLSGAEVRKSGHGYKENSTQVNPIDLNKYAEVIGRMEITFGSRGGGVDIDLHNKWVDIYSPGSDEPLRFYGAFGHDVDSLQLATAYLVQWKAESDAEEQARAKAEAGSPGGDIFPPVEQIRKDMRSAR